MKVLKIILIFLAALFVAGITILIDEPTVLDSIAAGLFLAMESFLVIDLRGLIQGTKKSDPGDWDDMHLYRYFIVMIIMALMSGISIYMYKVSGVNAVIAMTLYSSGVPVTMGLIIGGLQENRNLSRVEK